MPIWLKILKRTERKYWTPFKIKSALFFRDDTARDGSGGGFCGQGSVPDQPSTLERPLDLQEPNDWVLGNRVFDRLLLPGNAGSYRVNWDAKDLEGNEISSGIYFYKFSLNNVINSGRITYLK